MTLPMFFLACPVAIGCHLTGTLHLRRWGAARRTALNATVDGGEHGGNLFELFRAVLPHLQKAPIDLPGGVVAAVGGLNVRAPEQERFDDGAVASCHREMERGERRAVR